MSRRQNSPLPSNLVNTRPSGSGTDLSLALDLYQLNISYQIKDQNILRRLRSESGSTQPRVETGHRNNRPRSFAGEHIRDSRGTPSPGPLRCQGCYVTPSASQTLHGLHANGTASQDRSPEFPVSPSTPTDTSQGFYVSPNTPTDSSQGIPDTCDAVFGNSREFYFTPSVSGYELSMSETTLTPSSQGHFSHTTLTTASHAEQRNAYTALTSTSPALTDSTIPRFDYILTSLENGVEQQVTDPACSVQRSVPYTTLTHDLCEDQRVPYTVRLDASRGEHRVPYTPLDSRSYNQQRSAHTVNNPSHPVGLPATPTSCNTHNYSHNYTPHHTSNHTHNHIPSYTPHHTREHTAYHTHYYTPNSTLDHPHNHTPHHLPNYTSDHTQNYTPHHKPHHSPNYTSDQTHNYSPQYTPNHSPNYTSEHTQNYTPHHIPNQTHNYMPLHTPNNSHNFSPHHTPNNTHNYTQNHYTPNNTPQHTPIYTYNKPYTTGVSSGHNTPDYTHSVYTVQHVPTRPNFESSTCSHHSLALHHRASHPVPHGSDGNFLHRGGGDRPLGYLRADTHASSKLTATPDQLARGQHPQTNSPDPLRQHPRTY
ncbi:mucin-2-like [Physella acuta]|uniref:mucin-2-like n=1 Tax=Physella acuta TaxID=109671 RepID=UPI0027DE06F6|nr:mucin-2-like [Physella acuta]